MKSVAPKVYLISRPAVDWAALSSYLEDIGGYNWLEGKTHINTHKREGQDLVEIAGRACYKSWEPGLNENVTRIRKDQGQYLENILKSGHGSVLEHANYTFILQDVSRVFTHELVRHRVGVAISQESLRFVRADQLRVWIPPELEACGPTVLDLFLHVEDIARTLNGWLGVDEPGTSFEMKKKITSAIRRIFPQGMATDLVWTANIRTLRHCIEMRTALGAETEIRLVFDLIAKQMRDECPLLFGDYTVENGEWTTSYKKV